MQWAPGGKGAHTILERFVQNGLRQFNAHRAKTDRESTSSLSPHVHFGEISTRHIFYMVGMRYLRSSQMTLLSEPMIWGLPDPVLKPFILFSTVLFPRKLAGHFRVFPPALHDIAARQRA